MIVQGSVHWVSRPAAALTVLLLWVQVRFVLLLALLQLERVHLRRLLASSSSSIPRLQPDRQLVLQLAQRQHHRLGHRAQA